MSGDSLFHVPQLLAYWVHDLDPVILSFGENIAIRYYGLAYVLGFVLAFATLVWAARRGRSPLQPGELETLFTYLFLGVIVGGRIGYVLLYAPQQFFGDPLYLFRVWEGGMASHGGFAGVVVATLIFSQRHRHSPFVLGDLIALATPPGILLGRVANFINGELWGKVTDVSWAVIFPLAQSYPYFRADAFMVYSDALDRYVNPRHPSQLYAALLEGLVAGLYIHGRFWLSKTARKVPGQLAGEFFIAYALLRILSEVFREPDASLILGVSRGTAYSGLTLLAGIGLVVIARHFSRRPIP